MKYDKDRNQAYVSLIQKYGIESDKGRVLVDKLLRENHRLLRGYVSSYLRVNVNNSGCDSSSSLINEYELHNFKDLLQLARFSVIDALTSYDAGRGGQFVSWWAFYIRSIFSKWSNGAKSGGRAGRSGASVGVGSRYMISNYRITNQRKNKSEIASSIKKLKSLKALDKSKVGKVDGTNGLLEELEKEMDYLQGLGAVVGLGVEVVSDDNFLCSEFSVSGGLEFIDNIEFNLGLEVKNTDFLFVKPFFLEGQKTDFFLNKKSGENSEKTNFFDRVVFGGLESDFRRFILGLCQYGSSQNRVISEAEIDMLVLRFYYGQSLTEISEKYNLSKERIRQKIWGTLESIAKKTQISRVMAK